MPQFATKHFGVVPCGDEAVFEFPAGLPGFESEKRFLLIEQPHTKPIIFLQSAVRPELCFITVPLVILAPDYRLTMSPEDLRVLGLPQDRQPSPGPEILCLAIVSVAENTSPTANLLAPVVVNVKLRRAVQSIQVDSSYSHQHPLEREAPCS